MRPQAQIGGEMMPFAESTPSAWATVACKKLEVDLKAQCRAKSCLRHTV